MRMMTFNIMMMIMISAAWDATDDVDRADGNVDGDDDGEFV